MNPRNLEAIYQKLHERDYKVTPQRQIILKAFVDHAEQHLSAEEVYNIVKEEHPEIGLATVYRTLDLLADLEILEKMNFDDGRSRYEFAGQEIHHHHHLICVRCGRVMEFEDDLLETLEELVAKQTSFRVLDHQLKLYGLCQDCQDQE